jgi:hypothetical protein
MAEIIEAEAQTSDTDRKKRRRKLKGKLKAKGTTPESEDDAKFSGSTSEGSSSSDEGDESDEIQISNKEVIPTLSTVYGHLIIFLQLADSLPSKTIPAGKKRSSKTNSKKKQRPKKRPCHIATDTADEGVPLAPSTSSTAKPTVPKKVLRPSLCFDYSALTSLCRIVSNEILLISSMKYGTLTARETQDSQATNIIGVITALAKFLLSQRQ